MDATTLPGARPRKGRSPEESFSAGDPAPDTARPAPLSAEQVYHDYAPRVYNVARRMVANDTDAEDVTQDVLLQVVRKLQRLRGECAFPTWRSEDQTCE